MEGNLYDYELQQRDASKCKMIQQAPESWIMGVGGNQTTSMCNVEWSQKG